MECPVQFFYCKHILSSASLKVRFDLSIDAECIRSLNKLLYIKKPNTEHHTEIYFVFENFIYLIIFLASLSIHFFREKLGIQDFQK